MRIRLPRRRPIALERRGNAAIGSIVSRTRSWSAKVGRCAGTNTPFSNVASMVVTGMALILRNISDYLTPNPYAILVICQACEFGLTDRKEAICGVAVGR